MLLQNCSKSVRAVYCFIIVLSIIPLHAQNIIGDGDKVKLPDYLYFQPNGGTDAKWQNTTKSDGNFSVNGLLAMESYFGVNSKEVSLNTFIIDFYNPQNHFKNLTATLGYNSRAFTSLNGINSLNGIDEVFVIFFNSDV